MAEKRCPKCSEVDNTDFSTCRFCGTKYDYVKPKDFDSKPPAGVVLLRNCGIGLVGLGAIVWLAVLTIGNPASVIDDTTKKLQYDPKNVDLLLKRAHAHYVLNHLPSAEKDFTDAVRIAPMNPEVYRKRAEYFDNTGNPDSARKDREMLAKLGSK